MFREPLFWLIVVFVLPKVPDEIFNVPVLVIVPPARELLLVLFVNVPELLNVPAVRAIVPALLPDAPELFKVPVFDIVTEAPVWLMKFPPLSVPAPDILTLPELLKFPELVRVPFDMLTFARFMPDALLLNVVVLTAPVPETETELAVLLLALLVKVVPVK